MQAVSVREGVRFLAVSQPCAGIWLNAVSSRKAAHNNSAFYARSAARSALKLAYYRLLIGL